MHRWIPVLCLCCGLIKANSAETTNGPVTFLLPGFTVRELPVKLSNINNLRFAPDGSLTALGYDGRVWSLRDTDGDGLEDSVSAFWDRQTLSVPLGMAWSTRGLLVSSKGKVMPFKIVNQEIGIEEIVFTLEASLQASKGWRLRNTVLFEQSRRQKNYLTLEAEGQRLGRTFDMQHPLLPLSAP